MVRTAVAVGRIALAWHDDLSVQVLSACNRGVEVVEFKPQEYAVSVWRDGGIPDMAMMMLHIPPVQLKNQPAVENKPLILGPAVGALAAEETLIPSTARLDIGYANKWLWIHTNLVAETGTADLVGLASLTERLDATVNVRAVPHPIQSRRLGRPALRSRS
jgi:hypothetical protein